MFTALIQSEKIFKKNFQKSHISTILYLFFHCIFSCPKKFPCEKLKKKDDARKIILSEWWSHIKSLPLFSPTTSTMKIAIATVAAFLCSIGLAQAAAPITKNLKSRTGADVFAAYLTSYSDGEGCDESSSNISIYAADDTTSPGDIVVQGYKFVGRACTEGEYSWYGCCYDYSTFYGDIQQDGIIVDKTFDASLQVTVPEYYGQGEIKLDLKYDCRLPPGSFKKDVTRSNSYTYCPTPNQCITNKESVTGSVCTIGDLTGTVIAPDGTVYDVTTFNKDVYTARISTTESSHTVPLLPAKN
jgi:hypothetical protein